MRRGDVYWVAFDPSVGAEARKTRPAVIVSNDGFNRAAESLGRGVVTVVPLASSTDRVRSFQVLVPASGNMRNDSKAQCEQVKGADVSHFGRLIATLPDKVMADIDAALRLHLAL